MTIRLENGQTVKVHAPYFIKTPSKDKRRRKKRGPNGSGASLGLDELGFIGRCSPQFVSEVVKMAVLAPSFELAKEMLEGRGIRIDVKTIRRLCQDLGEIGLEFRYTHFPNHAGAAGPNQTIDYFFLSPDTQLINSYVRQRDSLHISDHLPLVAEFQIPRKQGRAL